MGNFVNRTTFARIRSGNDPDYADPPWLAVPPGSPNETVLDATPQQYLKISGDVLSEMTQGEKDAVDAAAVSALVDDNRATATAAIDNTQEPVGWETRSLIEVINQRDNYLTNRIEELQQALDAVKVSTGAVQGMKDAIPASWLATNTRDKPDAVQAYKDEISSGGADS